MVFLVCTADCEQASPFAGLLQHHEWQWLPASWNSQVSLLCLLIYSARLLSWVQTHLTRHLLMHSDVLSLLPCLILMTCCQGFFDHGGQCPCWVSAMLCLPKHSAAPSNNKSTQWSSLQFLTQSYVEAVSEYAWLLPGEWGGKRSWCGWGLLGTGVVGYHWGTHWLSTPTCTYLVSGLAPWLEPW